MKRIKTVLRGGGGVGYRLTLLHLIFWKGNGVESVDLVVCQYFLGRWHLLSCCSYICAANNKEV